MINLSDMKTNGNFSHMKCKLLEYFCFIQFKKSKFGTTSLYKCFIYPYLQLEELNILSVSSSSQTYGFYPYMHMKVAADVSLSGLSMVWRPCSVTRLFQSSFYSTFLYYSNVTHPFVWSSSVTHTFFFLFTLVAQLLKAEIVNKFNLIGQVRSSFWKFQSVGVST